MRGPQGIRALRSALDASFANGFRVALEQQSQGIIQQYTNQHAGAGERERLISAGLALPSEQLRELQERYGKEREGPLPEEGALLAAGLRQVKMMRRLQTAKKRHIVRLRKYYEFERGNPTALFCDWAADGIFPHPTLRGRGSFATAPILLQPRLGHNLIRFKLGADPRGRWGIAEQQLDTDFIWAAPPFDGMLSATTWINFAGLFIAGGPGHWLFETEARVSISAWMSIAQSQAGQALAVSSGLTRLVWIRHRIPQFTQVVTGGAIVPTTGDATLELGAGQGIPVLAGQPIVVRIGMYCEVGANLNATALIDFESRPELHVNIPSVWATLVQ